LNRQNTKKLTYNTLCLSNHIDNYDFYIIVQYIVYIYYNCVHTILHNKFTYLLNFLTISVSKLLIFFYNLISF